MERIILSLIILFLYAVEVVSFSFGDRLCSSHDSLSLLQFKHSLNVTDGDYCESSYPKTTSWNESSMDCCRWDGVTAIASLAMLLVWTSVVADLKELSIPIVAFSSFVIFKDEIFPITTFGVLKFHRGLVSWSA